MTKPICDKAEVAVEYPDKLYIGTFAHTARFDARLDQSGIALTLELPGPDEQRKSVHMHFHYALFAEILRDLAKTTAALPPQDILHREALQRQSIQHLQHRNIRTIILPCRVGWITPKVSRTLPVAFTHCTDSLKVL
jgi:hypothetical protein